VGASAGNRPEHTPSTSCSSARRTRRPSWPSRAERVGGDGSAHSTRAAALRGGSIRSPSTCWRRRYARRACAARAGRSFARDGAERLDFVISVLTTARPRTGTFRGRPVSAHWQSGPRRALGSAAESAPCFSTRSARCAAHPAFQPALRERGQGRLRSQLRDIGQSDASAVWMPQARLTRM